MIESKSHLKEIGKSFRDLYDRSPFSIALLDLRGAILEINSAATKLTGFKREELIGKNFLDSQVTPFNSIQKYKDYFKRIVNGESGVPFEVQIHTKDRGLVWVNGFCSLIVFGEETLIQAVIQDKNNHKLIEKSIERKKESLESFKEDLINRASHELKNPISNIYIAAELLNHLNNPYRTEEEQEIIDILSKQSQKLKNLINDLLETSRIERGKYKIFKHNENLSKIIRNCIRDMKYSIKARDIELDVDLLDKIELNFDPLRVEQVITNLLSNSLKNTPPKGRIFIKLKKSLKFAEITIKDTGIGLSDYELKNLFIKFSRFDRPEIDLEIIREGTGLGLYISKEIVELHDGQITAESEGRYKGSSFKVKLPLD